MRIFIDPGHGGADPGAVNAASGLKESTVNLDTALILGGILQGQGHVIRYSRTDDTAVSLSQRARMANDWPADLFISILLLAPIKKTEESAPVFITKSPPKIGRASCRERV